MEDCRGPLTDDDLMSEEIRDGGPAFPNPAIKEIYPDRVALRCAEIGLTKLEWLAGMAMQGMVCALTKFRDDPSEIIVNRPQDVSELAYLYARAMLKEGEKNGDR